MKHLFTFLLIFVCLPALAQQEEAVSYNGLVEVAGATRTELYERAQDWLKHVRYQVNFADYQSGLIMVGGAMRLRNTGDRKTRRNRLIYVVTVIVEDDRYWYDFAQLFYETIPANRRQPIEGHWVTANPTSPEEKILLQLIDATMQTKIEDLKRSMSASTENRPTETVVGNQQDL